MYDAVNDNVSGLGSATIPAGRVVLGATRQQPHGKHGVDDLVRANPSTTSFIRNPMARGAPSRVRIAADGGTDGTTNL